MNAITAALPARARLPLGIALVLAITLADWLVHDATVGLGFALFLCALPVLAGFAADEPPPRRLWGPVAALQALAVVPLLLQSNALTIFLALVGTLAACLLQRGHLRDGWETAVGETVAQAVLAPFRFVSTASRIVADIVESSPRSGIVLWLAPLALASIFVWLFASANPIIARTIEAIDVSALFVHVFGDRLWFWLGMAVLAAPFLHPAARQMPRVQTLAMAFALVRRPSEDATGREVGFAVRCLALFNAVFAVQTATDLAYLYTGAALPDGMTYAEYAHRGAYPLVATAGLAALFVVWTTRPGGPAAMSPLVTRLVLAWIAQNVLLLASSVLRLDLYVDAMGLTYWRIAAFVWMGLTGTGFALVVWRAFRGLSLGWLVAANTAVLLAALYVVGLVNWADVVARSQMARYENGEHSALNYVRRIGAPALPALLDHGTQGEVASAIHRARSKARMQTRDWRGMTLRRLELGNRLQTPYGQAVQPDGARP